MPKLVLAILLGLMLTPAATAEAAHQPQPRFLHLSEAHLAQTHDAYGKADKVKAFHVSLGSCQRKARDAVDCTVSLWRNDKYGIQLRCNYIVHATKAVRKGPDVRSTMPGYCGQADPKVPQPAEPCSG